MITANHTKSVTDFLHSSSCRSVPSQHKLLPASEHNNGLQSRKETTEETILCKVRLDVWRKKLYLSVGKALQGLDCYLTRSSKIVNKIELNLQLMILLNCYTQYLVEMLSETLTRTLLTHSQTLS